MESSETIPLTTANTACGRTGAAKRITTSPSRSRSAVGILLAALHHAGLVSLTYTPAPMGFLKTVLGRPENERPLVIVVAGYPAENVRVPDLRRKSLGEIATFI